ncbi:MAG: SMP-30/gluconolactonase/LRE family protein [Pirellulaceae bacterium]|nr:SMP-30/gluconolactonase/LRE family protein [Pirellulaceae bacterium]
MTKIVPADVLFRPTSEALRFLPEGPYPFGNDKFSWVAIQCGPTAKHGAINVYDWSSKQNESYELPGRPGFAFATNRDGVFVAGCEREIGLFSIRDRSWKVIASGIDLDREGTVINDAVAWDNNLVFGTKDLEFRTKKAGLYLYRGEDGRVVRLRDDQVCSNGKAILKTANGGLQLLDIDSPTRQIVVYDFDLKAAKLSEPRVIVDLTADPAVPDGMILTPDGKSVIVSMYNPNPAPLGETRQYRLSDGALEKIWTTLGSPQNTCPQLIAMAGKVFLVITTALEFLPVERRAQSPEAGTLFFSPTDWLTASESPAFQIPSDLS